MRRHPLLDVDTVWWQLLPAIGLALVIDDTWFYWTHRLLHHNRWLYRNVHLVHHRSTDPTPLTSQSFHPADLYLISLSSAFVVLIVGDNLVVLTVAGPFSIANNVHGHCGYELLPTWWRRVPLLNTKTMSSHHNMHHQRSKGGYPTDPGSLWPPR